MAIEIVMIPVKHAMVPATEQDTEQMRKIKGQQSLWQPSNLPDHCSITGCISVGFWRSRMIIGSQTLDWLHRWKAKR